MPLFVDPFLKLNALSERSVARIRTLCGPRFADLLLHVPTGYADKRLFTTVAEAVLGEEVTLRVKIEQHIPTARHKKSPWRIFAADDTGTIELIFFNGAKWLEKQFPLGSHVFITGKVEALLTEKQIHHPDVYPDTTPLENIACLHANYPLTAGIKQITLRKAIKEALAVLKVDGTFAHEWLPPKLVEKKRWPSFTQALETLHTPLTPEAVQPAKERLSFDELLAWQLALAKTRQSTKKQTGLQHPENTELLQKFLANLPFTLTRDQQKVYSEIRADLASSEPMLRLLQGDVGAGKTVVAFLAALAPLAAGRQVAIMAPTEILAMQHFENAKKYLEPLGISCILLKGKMPAKEKRHAHNEIALGHAQCVFGTHALIQKAVNFANLGLAIIDEQHRFGVRQRLALSGQNTLQPDVLVMTATPIPRTLSLTLYGDMDISILKEKPPGRTPIQTTALAAEKTKEIAYALKRILTKGGQAYWVCPLVEESEKSDLAAATKRFEALSKIYAGAVVLLHGKMKPSEKEKAMADFKAGLYKIMVATTVIEVGVDVPQATTMVIEHTQRFGLAQLHQLRGRVGRGSASSHCILLYDPPLGRLSGERINILRQTEDGFLIAEKDHELRGPGETLGTQQAGHQVTRIAQLNNTSLLLEARGVAEHLLKTQHERVYIPLLEAFNRHEAQSLIKSG